jgi:endonuclease/exonuclease/phosphatase family metal-dependent hydrolase
MSGQWTMESGQRGTHPRECACVRFVVALIIVATTLVIPQRLRAEEPQANAKADPAGELAVMTFNIRYDNPGDGKNAWPHRRDDVAEFIKRQQPDLLGLQEALHGQIADLKERLGDAYDWYGVGRDDGKEKGEFAPVFFRRARFEIQDKGSFWLSETPDKIGSKGWDAALPRVATWLKLKDKTTDKPLLFANVHFDHRGQQARRDSARLMRRKLLELAGDAPIVLVGDFNATPDSSPHAALVDKANLKSAEKEPVTAAVFRDARDLVAKPAGPDSTWNGFVKTSKGARIDHVFVDRHWKVASYAVFDERTKDGRFYSDHYPIVVKVRTE